MAVKKRKTAPANPKAEASKVEAPEPIMVEAIPVASARAILDLINRAPIKGSESEGVTQLKATVIRATGQSRI